MVSHGPFLFSKNSVNQNTVMYDRTTLLSISGISGKPHRKKIKYWKIVKK